MTYLEFFNSKFLKNNDLGNTGARHMKNDGLLNTSRPEKPIPDMHKTKVEPQAYRDLKNNSGAKIKGISKQEAEKLLTQFNISPDEWFTKPHMLGNTGIMISSAYGNKGFILKKVK